jgi:hypothetical protein
MRRAITMRGRLTRRRFIVLDEPVPGMEGEVEVVVRCTPRTRLRAPSPKERAAWLLAFRTWAEGHDRSLPLPRTDALLRDSIYDGRG